MRAVIVSLVVVGLVLAGDLALFKYTGGRHWAHLVLRTQQKHSYRVFGQAWISTASGSVCTTPTAQQTRRRLRDQAAALSTEAAALSQQQQSKPPWCRLPSTWRNCTQGIYVDVGTNVGVQLRKLYDQWQFPGAAVAGLYDETYVTNRSGVCAIGIEANPAHTPYLTTLNQYFKRKGYQALVLTETAASTRSGSAVFHFDPGSPVQWGASLAKGHWQLPDNSSSKMEGKVALFDLPAFMADIVRPLVTEVHQATGIKPPVGMKLDVEGEEYALLPALITNGGLCDLDMIYVEVHPIEMRSEGGAAANMTIGAIEDAFAHLRKVNPRCTTRYTHIDDELYLQAHLEVPLPL